VVLAAGVTMPVEVTLRAENGGLRAPANLIFAPASSEDIQFRGVEVGPSPIRIYSTLRGTVTVHGVDPETGESVLLPSPSVRMVGGTSFYFKITLSRLGQYSLGSEGGSIQLIADNGLTLSPASIQFPALLEDPSLSFLVRVDTSTTISSGLVTIAPVESLDVQWAGVEADHPSILIDIFTPAMLWVSSPTPLGMLAGGTASFTVIHHNITRLSDVSLTVNHTHMCR
jgi:hypothetical protein